MRVVTYNCTSWPRCRAFLRATTADVVCLQETHVSAGFEAEALVILQKQGWTTVSTPAQATERGGLSGGVLIVARSWLGLVRPPGGHTVVPGRAIVALLQLPRGSTIVVGSVYAHPGVGMGQLNVDLLAAVGGRIATLARPFLLAGDFNMATSTLADAGFAGTLGAVVSAPAHGTCRIGPGEYSRIDYFVLDGRLAQLVPRPEVDVAEPPAPHWPVALQLPFSRAVFIDEFHAPPRLPTEACFGPAPPANPSWEVDVPAEHATLDEWYAWWAARAEQELIAATGVDIVRGRRGRAPAIRRRLLRPPKVAEATDARRPLQWLIARLESLERLLRAEADARRWTGPCGLLRSAIPPWFPAGGPAADLLRAAQAALPRRSLTEVQALLGRATGALQHADAEFSAARKAEWREWAQAALVGAARAAHRWSRAPEPLLPPAATAGGTEAPPAGVLGQLRAQRALWAPMWAPQEDRYAVWPAAVEAPALPPLTAAMLREASGTFSRHTVAAPDGFHVRHFRLLSEPALRLLAELLERCERRGAWPSQTAQVVIALLPKPAGGFRPIGVFAGIYRLWIKARRWLCAQWEAQWARPYFLMSAGRRVTDALWRQAIENEGVRAEGSCAATLLWDLVKFYESVPHEALVREAVAVGFPLRVLRLCLQGYRACRHLSVQGALAAPVAPKRGVVAGCGAATTLVKVLMVRHLDGFVRGRPLELGVFVDDLQLSGRGPREEVADALPSAAAALQRIVEQCFGATISQAKAALVASDEQLARALRARVGSLAGAAVPHAKNLGVDTSAGRARSWHARSTARRARLAKARGRLPRLLRLRAAGGGRALHKVFIQGFSPAVTYGVEVAGMSPSELRTFRRMALATLPPYGGGRSSTLMQLMYGDPGCEHACAALLRWAREVWAAANGDSGCIALSKLGRLWREAAARPPASWRSAKGPLAVAMLECQRLGWAWPEPFILVVDEGKFPLTSQPPALLKLAIAEARRRQLEHAAGLAANTGPLTAEPWRRLCRRSKWTPRQRGLLIAFGVGGLWTRSRLADLGYATSPACPLCGEARDTEEHRLLYCQQVAQQRAEALAGCPRGTSAELKALAAHTLSRGLVEARPRRSPDEVKVEFQWEYADTIEKEAAAFEGDLYLDGACFRSAHLGRSSAGWAIVQLRDNEPVRAVFGPVLPPFPRTSQAAEWLAWGSAHQVVTGPSRLFADCASVVRMVGRGQAHASRPTAPYGGIAREAFALDGRRHILGTFKVQGHADLAAAATAELRTHAIGNDHADRFAKKGAKLWGRCSDEAEEAAEARTLARLAALVLAVWPAFPASGKCERTGQPAGTPAPRRRRRRHFLVAFGPGWRCTVCGSLARSRTAAGRCRGAEARFQRAVDSHEVIRAVMSDGLSLVLCRKCGAWGLSSLRKLREACAGTPSRAGAYALRRVGQGLFPKPDAQDRRITGFCRWQGGRTVPGLVPGGAPAPPAVAPEREQERPSSAAPRPSRLDALRARVLARVHRSSHGG